MDDFICSQIRTAFRSFHTITPNAWVVISNIATRRICNDECHVITCQMAIKERTELSWYVSFALYMCNIQVVLQNIS